LEGKDDIEVFCSARNSNAIDEVQMWQGIPYKIFKRKFVASYVSFGFVFFFFKLDLPYPQHQNPKLFIRFSEAIGAQNPSPEEKNHIEVLYSEK